MASVGNVEFRVTESQFRDLQKVLNPRQVTKALQVAVIRTTKAAMRIASKAVREKTTIPQKYIADNQNRHAAIKSTIQGYKENPVGYIIIRKVPLPLAAFKHKDSKTRGVTIDFGAIQPPLVLQHAFVRRVASARQMGRTSHLGVYTRARVGFTTEYRRSPSKASAVDRLAITPKGYAWRLPLKEHFGPTVLDYISRDEIRHAVLTKIGNEFEKQLDSQVSRFTSGKFKTVNSISFADLSETDTQANG